MDVAKLGGRIPRCLEGVRLGNLSSELDEVLGANFDAIREETLRFGILCTCGAETGRLLGIADGEIFRDPLVFECTGCKRTAGLFDGDVDGYNGEVEGLERKAGSAVPPPTAARDAFPCRSCRASDSFTFGVLLTYQGDDENFEGLEPVPLQNLFDVYVLAVRCTACNAVSEPIDFECA